MKKIVNIVRRLRSMSFKKKNEKNKINPRKKRLRHVSLNYFKKCTVRTCLLPYARFMLETSTHIKVA